MFNQHPRSILTQRHMQQSSPARDAPIQPHPTELHPQLSVAPSALLFVKLHTQKFHTRPFLKASTSVLITVATASSSPCQLSQHTGTSLLTTSLQGCSAFCLNINFVKLKFPGLKKEKKKKQWQIEPLESRTVCVAQQNCREQKPAGVTCKLQNTSRALTGLKKHEMPSFYAVLFKKEMELD